VGADKKTKRKRNKYVYYCRYKNIQKLVQDIMMRTCTEVLCRSLLVFFCGLCAVARPTIFAAFFFVLKKDFHYGAAVFMSLKKFILSFIIVMSLGCVGKARLQHKKYFYQPL
jgi:hypothetical protein